MSGHSKWHKIKHKKGAADAKKGVLFGRLAREITVAARDGGGDPDMNFRLRIAVDAAKSANLPKDNIERAIKKGTGELQGEVLEEITYEAMGPGGTAFVIEVVTDNRNRSVAEVRHAFTKHNGNFGAAVGWLFDRKGVIRLQETSSDNVSKLDRDTFELQAIEYGVDDIKEDDDGLVFYTAPNDLAQVQEQFQKNDYTITHSALEYIPKELITVSESDESNIEKILEVLDDNQDVSDVYTNF